MSPMNLIFPSKELWKITKVSHHYADLPCCLYRAESQPHQLTLKDLVHLFSHNNQLSSWGMLLRQYNCLKKVKIFRSKYKLKNKHPRIISMTNYPWWNPKSTHFHQNLRMLSLCLSYLEVTILLTWNWKTFLMKKNYCKNPKSPWSLYHLPVTFALQIQIH